MLPMPPPPADGPSRPWAQAPAAELAAVLGVFTDIDDTLTRDGAIEPQALAALHALHAAGLPVVAITGRPLGWSRPFVQPGPQAWPVRAIVAENGAVALIPQGGTVLTEFVQDAPTRLAHAARLQQVAAAILAAVPGAVLARDSAGRATDIAIDHAEHARLDAPAIAHVVALMQAAGMNATVSSIHVNGWFGTHTKFSAAQWMLQRLFGRRLEAEIGRWVYVGDSTNDQLMFARFPLAVGVANLLAFADRLQHWPAYLTAGERGAGFAEVAQRLLAARGAP
jgi:HAD superfamily hydrolase (TIGR01484 family)